MFLGIFKYFLVATPLENMCKYPRTHLKLFATDFLLGKQKFHGDNKRCQPRLTFLCNKILFPPFTATQQWSKVNIGNPRDQSWLKLSRDWSIVFQTKTKNIVDHQIEIKTKLFIKHQINLNWVDEKFSY